tara:strand:- start:636 stop:764 length:129 start_codon:yes stop_codon:yes gene_type:complete
MEDQEQDPGKFPLVRGKVMVFAILSFLFSLGILVFHFVQAIY